MKLKSAGVKKLKQVVTPVVILSAAFSIGFQFSQLPSMTRTTHLSAQRLELSSNSPLDLQGSLRSDEALRSLLSTIFSRLPSARNLSDPERLRQAAEIVAGPEKAHELQQIFEHESARFNLARRMALATTPIRPNGKSLVVSGLSASGSGAAMIAAHAGYAVTGFESRGTYTRNIQWTGRQSIIDTLAVIDPALSDRFMRELVHPISQEVSLIDHHVSEVLPLSPARSGDVTRIPDSSGEMIDQDTVMLMQTKEVEKLMMSALRQTQNIDVRVGQSVTPVREDSSFGIQGFGRPDLFIVAEGSGSKSRRAMGIDNVPTSPPRLQIAGELKTELGGNLAFNAEHVTYADGHHDVLLTSAISNAGSGSSWSVTDVPRDLNLEPAGLTAGTEEYKNAKQDLVNKYYIHALANVLRRSEAEVRTMVLSGPIEKGQPTPFFLQQNISRSAVYGDNAIGLGDAIGNAHWNVGGGVHIALVSHLRRLSNLLFDLEIGRDRAAAMNEYNQRVLSDSLEWGRRGCTDFYPDLDPKIVREAFDQAVAAWMKNPRPDQTPNEIMQKLLSGVASIRQPPGHSASGLRCEMTFAL